MLLTTKKLMKQTNFWTGSCNGIENYVGKTLLDSKLCKKLVELCTAYRAWTETKTRVHFAKKVFFENLDM